MGDTLTEGDLKLTQEQADYELDQLLPQSIYTLIATTINGMVKAAVLIWFPLLFSAYNVGGVLNPITVGLMVFVCYTFDVFWMKLCGHADLPSVSMLIQEMWFILYRVPYVASWPSLTLRLKAMATRYVTFAFTVFGTTLGIYIVTLREGNAVDTNTSQSNVGQPLWDNSLLSHGTMIFVVGAMEFSRSLTNHRVYLGPEVTKRVWPMYDRANYIKLSPYKASMEAAIAMFTIPLTGGFVTYEWVFATAMVTRQSSDTDLFTGMLIVGTTMALIVSWLMYTWPKISNYLMHKRTDWIKQRSEQNTRPKSSR